MLLVVVLLYDFLDSQLSVSRNSFNFGKVPFLVTERTNGTSFEPTLDAIQVEDVSAVSKSDAQSVVVGGTGIGLILNGGFVERIATNSAL